MKKITLFSISFSSHLSFTDSAAPFARDLVDQRAVIESADERAGVARQAHQRGFDSGEKDPIEFLYVVLLERLQS